MGFDVKKRALGWSKLFPLKQLWCFRCDAMPT